MWSEINRTIEDNQNEDNRMASKDENRDKDSGNDDCNVSKPGPAFVED